MDSIKNLIKEKRPSLTESSVNTYVSILRNLYKKVFGDTNIDIDKFNDSDKILKYLDDVQPNKRKTILSSLVVVTNKKEYRDQMMDDVKNYNDEIAKQEKSKSQSDNWVDSEQIHETLNQLKRNADLIYKKSHRTVADLQDIQSYIIVCLLGGVYVSPRRSLDYCHFKIKNIDKSKENYLDKNKLVFNTYKTSKTYGQQIVEIPTALKSILNKWIKHNPTEYLLFDINMNPLTSVKLNQRLNKIFGDKKVGINILRHSYLSDKYQSTIKQQEDIDKTMENMGSSANMLTTYVKKP